VRLRRSPFARADLTEALRYSRAEHGEAGLRRYRALIETALHDIVADPFRPNSRDRPELADGVRSYRIRHSRDRSPEARVRAPCHVLYYRVTPSMETVTLLRVLQDSWEPDPGDFGDE
jgi:toxin ParE1/3/4